MRFFSDGAGRKRVGTDAQPTSHVVISDGECNVVGDSVCIPYYFSNYGSNLACDIRFRSDGTLLVNDFATENSVDYFLLDWDTYSESTGPDDISVTSDSLLVLTTRDGCCVLKWFPLSTIRT